mgnify:CR=1 FL=1
MPVITLNDYKNRGIYRIMECLGKLIISTDIDQLSLLIDKFLHIKKYNREVRDIFYIACLSELRKVSFKSITEDNVISSIRRSVSKPGMLSIIPGSINKIQMISSINSGAYGDIWDSNINDYSGYVTKLNKNSSLQANADIWIESLIHVLLQCNKDELKNKCESTLNTTFIWPIPELKYILNAEINGQDKGLIIGMEKLSMNLGDFFTKSDKTMLAYNLHDILAQLSISLYMLQQTTGFIHRDLHSGNIMLIERPVGVSNTYNFNGYKHTCVSNYEVKIIDFGQSCMDLQLCGAKCEINNSISGYATSYKDREALCENYFFDLKFLLKSINKYISISGPQFNTDKWKKLIRRTNKGILEKVAAYPEKFAKPLKPEHWHNSYGMLDFVDEKNGISPEIMFAHLMIYSQ